MFRLPVCPHCGAVYYYKDVVKASKNKEAECSHCKNRFEVKKKSGFAVLGLIIFLLAVCVNLILLNTLMSFNAVLLLCITAFLIVLGCVFYPYFVSFKKSKK